MSGNNSDNMPITADVKNALNRLVEHVGTRTKVAEMLGISKLSVCRWIGTKSGTQGIAPGHWLALRQYMEENGIVQSGDVRYMLPSEIMRDAALERDPSEELLVNAYRQGSADQRRMLLAMAKSIIATDENGGPVG